MVFTGDVVLGMLLHGKVYGMSCMDGILWMKPTMLFANCRCVPLLDRRCCGRHDHFVLSWTSAAVYTGVVL